MAHHKSAIKRIRQTKKLRLYNRGNKRLMKQALRGVEEAKTPEEAQEKYNNAQKVIDKISARGVIHKNKAARKKAQLAKLIKTRFAG